MKIISLFSGAGGLDLGLIQAGNTVIWANDIDKDAVATYKENIGDHPFKYNGEDTIANGFAMRTDIHTLFDTGHLRISETGIVELSTRARMDYGATIPPKIVLPDFTNRDFIRWRWENYNGI